MERDLTGGIDARVILRSWGRTWAIGPTLLVAAATAGCSAPEPPTLADNSADVILARPAPHDRAETEQVFSGDRVHWLLIALSASTEHRFREDLRKYVPCELLENEVTSFSRVAIKLKGAAGSFRELDDKPAFTLNMNKFHKGQTFHGLDKWHLNNSVQDESYLSEKLCAAICAEAGLPTPRVAHARLWLNDRELGLYVLKEGFDRRFLKRHFRNADGNLYDGGFLQDLDQELEKDAGDGPDDGSDLRALREACLEADVEVRWQRIEERLDLEAFLRFMAFEMMSCHWDGYTLNKNNYRLYFEPRTGRAYFLPHGMDQMFGDPGFPLFEYPEPLVSGIVMQNPEWRSRYRQILREMLPLFDAERWTSRLAEWQQALRPAIDELGGEEAVRNHAERVRELQQRVTDRYENLRQLIDSPDPETEPFDEKGRLLVADWHPVEEFGGARLEQLEIDGRNCYLIAAGDGGDCIASFRRRLLLSAGDYRLEARMRGRGIEPREDPQGAGGGLRVSGSPRENQVIGSGDWETVRFDFRVEESRRPIDLVAELRATAGELWIDAEIFLYRLP